MNRLRIIFDALLSVNERDICGMFVFLVLSLYAADVCGWKGVLVLLGVMILRELVQYKMYHLPSFEWEDVVRYSLIIFLGYLVILVSIKF